MNTLSLPSGIRFDYSVTLHDDGTESYEIGQAYDQDGAPHEPANTLQFLDDAEREIEIERGFMAAVDEFDTFALDAEIPMSLYL